MTVQFSVRRAGLFSPGVRRTHLRRIPAALVACLLAAAALVEPARAQTRNFIWKASRGPAAIYLVGSVHLLSKDYYPLSPALDKAFAECDLLVEELHLGQMASVESQMTILTRGLLPSGQTLDKVISPETFALVNERVKALGMPVEPLKRFKPWALALTLLGLEWQAAGFDAALGLDKHFYDQAVATGKTVQGLETIEFQISRFDELTMEEQDRMLASTLRELETEKAAVTTLANAWKAGDAPTVERIVLQELRQEPKMYQRLLVERNRDWMPKIEALFARKTPTFVVVGAAHLVGNDGLLAMLKAKGYTVEQL
jgi:uncharacterized protein YbaP (TraB family)